MNDKEFTLNEFQTQCSTTAMYSNKIDGILEPIQDLIDGCPNVGSSNVDDAGKALDEVRSLLNILYAVLGLAGEAGEVANKAKKIIRDGADPSTLTKEVQGVNWYVNACYSELGVSANDAAHQLSNTLQSRKERGVIQGNGDNR